MNFRFLAFTITLLLLSNSAFAADLESLRAAFILQFVKYTEWPTPPETVQIQVVDDADTLKKLQDLCKSQNGTKVNVSRYDSGKGSPNVIFIKSGDLSAYHSLLDSYKNKPVLLVSETSDKNAGALSINFFKEEDHLRFEVIQKNLDLANLKMSAQLLKLSKHAPEGQP